MLHDRFELPLPPTMTFYSFRLSSPLVIVGNNLWSIFNMNIIENLKIPIHFEVAGIEIINCSHQIKQTIAINYQKKEIIDFWLLIIITNYFIY